MALTAQTEDNLMSLTQAYEYIKNSTSSVLVLPQGNLGITGFLFDIKLSETTSFTSAVSENVVENGSTVADHIRIKPINITITGLIGEVNTKLQSSTLGQFKDYIRERLVAVSEFLPPKTRQQTQQLVKVIDDITSYINRINRTLSTFQNLVGMFKNDVFDSRVANQVAKLRALYQSKIACIVETDEFTYQNMYVSDITTKRTSLGQIEVICTLKEILFASTTIIQQPNNRSDIQSQNLTKNGNVKLTPPINTASFAKNTLNKIF